MKACLKQSKESKTRLAEQKSKLYLLLLPKTTNQVILMLVCKKNLVYYLAVIIINQKASKTDQVVCGSAPSTFCLVSILDLGN